MRLIFVLIMLITYLLPIVAASFSFDLASEYFPKGAWATGILSYLVMQLSILCVIGWATKRGIVEGKFSRKLSNPIYLIRRIYGFSWSSIFYFTPLYNMILNFDPLKKIIFRAFGYKGTMKFTLYPDAWIRDLPLLSFGKNSYIANRCTLGTNLCVNDAEIIVGKISIGDGAVVGHGAIVGLGSKIDANAEIGIHTAIGLKCTIGKNSKISPASAVNHGATIGSNCVVGASSYIGVKANIGDNISLAAGSNIPAGAVIRNQDQADSYHSSETKSLRDLTHRLFSGDHSEPQTADIVNFRELRNKKE